MSINKEDYRIDGEQVLHDVIHIVCKHAKATDLSNMAEVCKSWRSAALREKDKRYYVQQLHLSYKMDNVANSLDVIPFVSLLVYDSRLEKSLSLPASNYVHSNGLEEELLEDFKTQLPNKIIVLRVDRYFTTEDVTFQGTKEQRDVELRSNCEILGLFFPSMEQRIRVDVAWMDLKFDFKRINDQNYVDEFLNENPKITSFAEELGLRTCEYPKSTILLLTYTGIENHNRLLSQLRRRTNRNGKEIIWASICGTLLAAGNHGENHGQSNVQNTAALRFSGPSVESWSTFIHFLARHDEVESKLQKLKEQVKRKKHYIGLFYSLNCVKPGCNHVEYPCVNSHEMMHNLKRIFPDIQFKGFVKDLRYLDCQYFANQIVCADRPNVDRAFDEELLQNLLTYTSIIIISYD